MSRRTTSRLLLDQRREISDVFRQCVSDSCMTLEEIRAEYHIDIVTLKKIVSELYPARTTITLKKMIKFSEAIKGKEYVSRIIEDEEEFDDIIDYDHLKRDIVNFVRSMGFDAYYDAMFSIGIGKNSANLLKRSPKLIVQSLKIEEYIKLCISINQNPTKYLCK